MGVVPAMARGAEEDDFAAREADDGGDDAERRGRALQDRSLLDVRLEKHVGQRPALHARATAREAALLVPERGDGERAPGASDALDRLEAGEHAEDAVEAAAVRHRVEMRAGPDLARTGLVALETSEQVPVRVDLDGEPRLFDPAGDEVVRALLAVAAAGTIRAGPVADGVDLFYALENPHGTSVLRASSTHAFRHGRGYSG